MYVPVNTLVVTSRKSIGQNRGEGLALLIIDSQFIRFSKGV